MNEIITAPLPCEIVGPKDARNVVIWLHGLGASGHDFVPIVPMLNRPNTKFIFPHAPRRPVTINMGYKMPAWYDILHLEEGPNRESAPEILSSTGQINALVDAEISRGVHSQQIILAGFSQGGAMALHAAIRYSRPLGGIMVLSAYEVRSDTRDDESAEANQDTPMLFCHGLHDPVVPIHRGREAFNVFAEGNREVVWHDYSMAHEVCGAEIRDIAQWLSERLDT